MFFAVGRRPLNLYCVLGIARSGGFSCFVLMSTTETLHSFTPKFVFNSSSSVHKFRFIDPRDRVRGLLGRLLPFGDCLKRFGESSIIALSGVVQPSLKGASSRRDETKRLFFFGIHILIQI